MESFYIQEQMVKQQQEEYLIEAQQISQDRETQSLSSEFRNLITFAGTLLIK